MEHVVGFSGGAASAVCAKIVLDTYGSATLLFHDTKTEPSDNDRFRDDVAKFLGLPITNDSDGRDIWQVFKDEGYLGNGRNTPCSRILKQERSLAYLKAHQPATLYLGFTVEEWRRAQRTYARYHRHGIRVAFPLIEQKIGKADCLHRITTCWGLRLPDMYQHFGHANCMPCVKGGLAYWGLVYLYERPAWERAVQAEKEFGKTIFTKAGSLRKELDHCLKLAREAEAAQSQAELMLFPCECAI
ncbi:MAG: phosphoadenosine phosphosulfate reductase domain-containing protein [Planctomycetota bacterium]|jgi:hypothetical protein